MVSRSGVEVRRVVIPAGELARLVDLCRGTNDPAGAIVECWRVVGVDLAAVDGPVDPTAWAIPSDQWKAICGALVEGGHREDLGDGVTGVNWALTWMNVGPSAFDR